MQHHRVSLRTRISPQVPCVDLKGPDLSGNTPVMMLVVHEKLAGDITNGLLECSHDANSAHLTHALGK
jgi:hypothetical protein